MDGKQIEQDLLKRLGEAERRYLTTKAEIEAQLDKIRPRRNYIGPLSDDRPVLGSMFRRLFGFDL